MQIYSVKEIYFTIQGEGMQTGKPAIFCRFAGCNLWNGREEDRHKAICKFCDTDFFGTDGEHGGKYTAKQLAEEIKGLWPDSSIRPYIVCTGGEPLLQLDRRLIHAFHSSGFEIAIETNGTISAPDEIDWICMSPKANTKIVQKKGDELKLVFPQKGISPDEVSDLDFTYFFLQPMDGPNLELNTRKSIEYCLKHPKWRLSLQTHKFSGLK